MNKFKVTIALSLLVPLSAACQRVRLNKNKVPVCIQSFIDSGKASDRWYVGNVEEYLYQGKLVYAFNPSRRLADGATFIKTSACKDLCSVGGFAGPRNKMCNGDDFFSKAKFKRRIWGDERK